MLNWPFPISPLRQFDGECDNEYDEEDEEFGMIDFEIKEDYSERMKRISSFARENYWSIDK